MINLINADVIEWAEQYKGDPFHALLCDAPYHLTSIVKRYGTGIPQNSRGESNPYSRVSKGFMNTVWDGGDLAFQPETWATFSRLLYPGAFGAVFASSRGWHRLAAAIEDSGLIIHPSIFGWAYGSGFPKATRIDTQIDKAAGAERGTVEVIPDRWSGKGGVYERATDMPREYVAKTAPATELAQVWEPYRYGLQALKPALEPIIIFQKPYEGKPIENIVGTGAGALNIGGSHIGTEPVERGREGRTAPKFRSTYDGATKGYAGTAAPGETAEGRWPSNLYLSHSPFCQPKLGKCVRGCPVQAIGDQAPTTKSSGGGGVKAPGKNGVYGRFNGADLGEKLGLQDEGTVARYFPQVDWNHETEEKLLEADPVHYCPKASGKDRAAGLGDLPDTTILDGREKSIDNAYQRGETTRKNPHPTVKPLALNKWLAGLLLPPDYYSPRRLFVPFAGVASECIAAALAGWDEIIGVELDPEYIPVALKRIAHWIKD